MFIGHFGVGFAAKAVAPQVSLGTLFLAAQFIDLLWPTLLLLGVERVRIEPGITTVTPLNFEHYPVSHSLLAVLGWSLLLGGVYFWRRGALRGAVVVGLAVLSHWLLDLLVHRPDLPLYPGATQFFGLGLWSSLGATLAVELPIFAAGVWLYLRATEAGRPGRPLGVVGLGGVPGRRLSGQPVRRTAAERHGDRMDRPGAVASRRVGVLGRSPPARGRRRLAAARGARRLNRNRAAAARHAETGSACAARRQRGTRHQNGPRNR